MLHTSCFVEVSSDVHLNIFTIIKCMTVLVNYIFNTKKIGRENIYSTSLQQMFMISLHFAVKTINILNQYCFKISN